MNLEIKGGYATDSGFKLITDKVEIEAIRQGDHVEVKEKPRISDHISLLDKITDKLRYIPLVGSALEWLSFLTKNKSSMVLLLFAIAIMLFVPQRQEGKPIDNTTIVILVLLSLYWAYWLIIMLPKYMRYHSVEHMTIDCLIKRNPVTIESLRSCSRLTVDCGSILVMIAILLEVIFIYKLRWNSPLVALLSLIIATDIKRAIVALKLQWLFWPFLQLERVVCWTPSNEDFELGVALGQRFLAIQNTQ